MPEPTLVEQPQRAVEAALDRRTPAAGGVTAAEQVRLDAVESIRKQRAANIEDKKIAESFSPHPPPTEARVRQVNNENIGTKRKGGDGADAGDKEYVAGERSENYRKRADKFADLTQELLKDGFDGLSNDGIWAADQKKNFIRTEMLEAFKSSPSARAVLESYGPYGNAVADAGRNQMIDDILRNPEMMKKLSAHFGELYKEGGGDSKVVFEDVITQAQETMDKAKAELDAKQKEFDMTESNLQNVERKYQTYRPGGIEYSRMNLLRTASANWQNELRVANSDIARLEREKAIAEARRFSKRNVFDYDTTVHPPVRTGSHEEITEDPAIASRVSSIENNLLIARGTIDNIQEQQNRLEAMTKESAEIERERNELALKKDKLEGELGVLHASYQTAETKYNTQRALRMAQEEEFTNNIEGMVRESGRRFLKDEVGRYEQAQTKIAEKEGLEASDRDEKNIQNAMKEKWRKDEVKRGRTISKVNKGEVRASYDVLIKNRSAESFVKDFMEKEYIRLRNAHRAGSVQAQEERRRLDERYKDKEFMKKMEGVVSERLLKNYLESGGKIRPEDASILTETEWGEQAVDAALAKNKEADALVDKLKNANAFTGSKKDFLKALARNPDTYKKGGIGIAALLALIFGAPFLIAGAGLAYSGYSAIGAATGVSTV